MDKGGEKVRRCEGETVVRLNLGSGDWPLWGYENLDIKNGRSVYPLGYGDETVDEVRASHLLEHFSVAEGIEAMAEWYRVLRPGGRLRVAVPDFAKIVQIWQGTGPWRLGTANIRSQEDRRLLWRAWLLGGQVDRDDFHKSVYDESHLRALFEATGFERVGLWDGEMDSSAEWVSLNVEGWKGVRSAECGVRSAECGVRSADGNGRGVDLSLATPMPCEAVGCRLEAAGTAKKGMDGMDGMDRVGRCEGEKVGKGEETQETHVGLRTVEAVGATPAGAVDVKIAALLSCPRVGWNDAWGYIQQALRPFKIPVWRCMGAYWEQGVQNTMEDMVAAGMDWILVLDYDSVFTERHLDAMFGWFGRRPDVDALVPAQVKRGTDYALASVMSLSPVEEAPVGQLIRLNTGHFGCTLIRVESLVKAQKPWFWSQPGPGGTWRHAETAGEPGWEGRMDADIWFWHQWRLAGNTVWLAPDVRIGHLELQVAEFDEALQARRVYVDAWTKRELNTTG